MLSEHLKQSNVEDVSASAKVQKNVHVAELLLLLLHKMAEKVANRPWRCTLHGVLAAVLHTEVSGRQ